MNKKRIRQMGMSRMMRRQNLMRMVFFIGKILMQISCQMKADRLC